MPNLYLSKLLSYKDLVRCTDSNSYEIYERLMFQNYSLYRGIFANASRKKGEFIYTFAQRVRPNRIRRSTPKFEINFDNSIYWISQTCNFSLDIYVSTEAPSNNGHVLTITQEMKPVYFDLKTHFMPRKRSHQYLDTNERDFVSELIWSNTHALII